MIRLIVNGAARDVHADPDTPLLWVLRDHLGLTGTKFGCGAALCGALFRVRRVFACRSAFFADAVIGMGEA